MLFFLPFQWDSLPPFTEEKCTWVVATEFDGKVIIAYTVEREDEEVLCLTSTTDFRDWRPLKTPDGMGWCFSLCSVQGHLYGAFWNDESLTEGGENYPVLYKLTTVDGEWSKLPDGRFRQAQLACATVVWEDKLLTIGGTDNTTTVMAVEGYDLINEVWCDSRTFSPLPKGLYSCKAMIRHKQLHVIGGLVEDSESSDNEPNSTVYTCASLVRATSDLPECKWICHALPETPRGACGVASSDECPVVAGGIEARQTKSPSSEVFYLDSERNIWLQLPSLKVARAHPSLVRFGDKLVAIGGSMDWDPRSENITTVEVMQLNI